MHDWDLIEIGEDTVVEGNCMIVGSALAAGIRPGDPGTISFGHVTIGKNCTLSCQTVVKPGTTVPDNGCVRPGTATTYPDSLRGKPIDGEELRTAHDGIPVVLQCLSSFVVVCVYSYAWLAGALPVAYLWKFIANMEW